MSVIVESLHDLRDKVIRGKKLDWKEENTKMAIISKVLQLLDYDITEPDEVDWESSVGIAGNNGEKVDFAVYLGEKYPEFIIEAKAINVDLDNDKLWNQLFTYFSAMRPHIAILTNGDDWWFYTDKESKNLLDREPYLKLSITQSTKDELVRFEQYSRQNIKNIDLLHEVIEGVLDTAIEELYCKLLMGYMPDYIVSAFIKHYNLEDKVTTEFVKKELEAKLATQLLAKRGFTDELSPELEARANRFNQMVTLSELQEYTDCDSGVLKHIYIFDTPMTVSSWENLFKRFILLLCEKSPDNLELLCDSDLWTNNIKVYRSKNLKDSVYSTYYTDYDISVCVHGTKKAVINRLIAIIEALGLGRSVISFDIDREDVVKW